LRRTIESVETSGGQFLFFAGAKHQVTGRLLRSGTGLPVNENRTSCSYHVDELRKLSSKTYDYIAVEVFLHGAVFNTCSVAITGFVAVALNRDFCVWLGKRAIERSNLVVM
jgi:hypothetical protein